MQVKCAHTELVDVDLLTANPRNPNKHPDSQIKLLAKIMAHQGWISPVVVSNRSGFITKGHGRLMAAKMNGWTSIPVDRQDYATEADEYADMVADNKIAELAETDLAMVNEMALELPDDFDLELLGIPDFNPVEVEVLEPQCDEDDVGELPAEPKTKRGDIYQLGRHRLMCGDATSIDDAEKLVNGVKIDMVFTSPPYNFGKAGFEKKGKYENTKDTDDDEWLDLVSGFLSTWPIVSEYQFVNLQILAGNKIKIHEWLYNFRTRFVDQMVLVKSTLPAMEKNILNAEFECMYIFRSVDLPKKHIHLGKEFRGNTSNIFEMKRSSGEFAKVHRAAFDVSFPEKFIEMFLGPNATIADPFGGTGTTMIAAEKTGRTAYLCELDPGYCDVIVNRWEKYTGKTAELITPEEPPVIQAPSKNELKRQAKAKNHG